MSAALWIVQGLLAAIFLFAGGAKLVLPLDLGVLHRSHEHSQGSDVHGIACFHRLAHVGADLIPKHRG